MVSASNFRSFGPRSSGKNAYICLYNFDPLKLHFYIVKLGFTWIYIIFLIFVQNIDCGYLLEPPHLSGSNMYPQSMFCFLFLLKNTDCGYSLELPQ